MQFASRDSQSAGFSMACRIGLLAEPPVEGVALDAWNPNGLLVALRLICAG
jgi:hypothetical protein